MIKKHYTFLLFFSFIFLFFSCDKDENNVEDQMLGAWQLRTVLIDGQQEDITGKNEIVHFAHTFVFKRYLTDEAKYRIGGWSMAGGMLNISLDQPAAYYVQTVNATQLSVKRHDFNDNGDVVETIFNYEKVSEDLLP